MLQNRIVSNNKLGVDTSSKRSLNPNIKLYNMCAVLVPPTDKFRFIERQRYKVQMCDLSFYVTEIIFFLFYILTRKAPTKTI